MSAAAGFGDAESAALFLEVVGALREASVEVVLVSPPSSGVSLIGSGVTLLA